MVPQSYNPSPVENFHFNTDMDLTCGWLLWYARPQLYFHCTFCPTGSLGRQSKHRELALVFVATCGLERSSQAVMALRWQNPQWAATFNGLQFSPERCAAASGRSILTFRRRAQEIIRGYQCGSAHHCHCTSTRWSPQPALRLAMPAIVNYGSRGESES